MSVIVEDDNKKILLFCKGADNVIYERLHAASPDSVEQKNADITLSHLEEFATVGLRSVAYNNLFRLNTHAVGVFFAIIRSYDFRRDRILIMIIIFI